MKRHVAALMTIVLAATVYVQLGSAPVTRAQDGMTIGRVHETYQPIDGKVFVLIIGSDARRGNPTQRSATGPDINADAIHIAGVNTRTMKGGILNIPRDSWVPVPGYGHRRINDALNRGGPQLLARTVENLTGIRLDYWVLTGFEGFQGALGDLGGVRMNVPNNIYDPGGSGANLRAGTQRLMGYQALAFMRTRKSFSSGDVARTTNHGELLLALHRKLRNELTDNPARLLRWMSVTRRRTAHSLSESELFRLAILVSQVKPADVGNVTVPVSLGTAGAAEVVFIQSGAGSIYSRFARRGSL